LKGLNLKNKKEVHWIWKDSQLIQKTLERFWRFPVIWIEVCVRKRIEKKWKDFCKRNFLKENKFWSKIELKQEKYFSRNVRYFLCLSSIKRFVIFVHYQIEQRKILINMKFVFTAHKKRKFHLKISKSFLFFSIRVIDIFHIRNIQWMRLWQILYFIR
jgi:hypothetical protein